MKSNITPLRQTTEFGCMATCYAMVRNTLFGEEMFNQEIESNLTKQAFSFETEANEHFYLHDLATRGCDIRVLLETPYIVDLYQQLNNKFNLNIPIEYSLIGIKDFENLLEEGYILITLIDRWQIDMYIHMVHYVVVHGFDENHLYITDPKYGRELKIAKERFKDALVGLKVNIGYSPLIFAIRHKK